MFVILHHIIMFQKGMTAIEWSKAIISPIPKDKTRSLYGPLNYRGIGLLPCIVKPFSCFISNRLTKYCDMLDIIVDKQNGFRKNL